MLHLPLDLLSRERTTQRRYSCVLALFMSLTSVTPKAVAAERARKTPSREMLKKAPQRSKHRHPGVRGMFEAAQELYEAGKYDAAVNAFEALLRKYPSYDAAILQLARSNYKLDRFKDASVHFERVNIAYLDPETSYEYGWTFYSIRSWEKALLGFKRVPPGHAFYDLANYYGGICALKLKRYEESEELFDKAVVLPDKLAKTRQVYLKHLQALRIMYQKNQLAKEREAEREVLEKTSTKKKSKDEKSETTDAASATPTPPATAGSSLPAQHLGYRNTAKYAFAGFETERQLIDNFGTKRGQFNANVSTFDFGSGPQSNLPIVMDGNRQGALGLNLALNAEYRISKGDEQRLVIDEKNDDIQRLLSKELPTKYQKSGRWTVGPWIEFPLPLGLWTALSGEVSYKFPDIESSNRTGNHRGTLEIGGKSPSGLASAGSQIYYQELINPKSQLATAISGARIGAAFELPSHLGLGTEIGYEVYDYRKKQLPINGPDSLAIFQLNAVQAFPLGFTLKVSGTVEKSERYVFFEMPTYDTLIANGTAVSGLVVLALGPQLVLGTYPGHVIITPPFVPYVQMQVSGLVRKTYWDLARKEAREVFEYNVPDYVERVNARITLNLNF